MSSQPWHERWVHPKDSVVIISGAGLATALLAAKQGYQVAAWDISEAGISRTQEAAGPLVKKIHPIICDIGDENAVKEAMQRTTKIGKHHMLVNNASPVATGKTAGIMDMMMDAAMKMIHYVTTAFLETNPETGLRIVNISSRVGPIFGGGGSRYAAAKAAIAALSRSLLVELKGYSRVNTVAPGGPVRASRNATFIDQGVFAKILNRNHPTGRPGLPEAFVNGIMFLLSPAASYVNGHLLAIDGGPSIAE
ncbi:hypothetical protein BDV12DRAFT_192295 [Aspergillus spectabilis]